MSPRPVEPEASGLDADQAAEAEAEALAEAEAAGESVREVTPSLTVADRQTLVDAGDTEGLIALAKAYRAGTLGLKQDPTESFACYLAAAELGDLSARHAVGVFHLMGGLGAVDEEAAAVAFRAAANAGFLLSKVYVANFYELGIHYAPNEDKADVWYRSVARVAEVDAEEGSSAYVRALADLGCVRYCLAIVEDPTVDDDERDRYRRKARAYGYTPERAARREALASAEPEAPDDAAEPSEEDGPNDASTAADTPAEAVAGDPEGAPDAATKKPVKDRDEAKAKRDENAVRPTPRLAWGDAGAAIILSFVAMVAAVGLGYALSVVAPQYAAAGTPWPVVGAGHPLALAVLVGTLGLLPNFLVYRWYTVIQAVAVAGLVASLGEYLWVAQHLQFQALAVQVPLFAAGGLLLALYVLALFGGVRVGWELAHGLDPLD